MATKRTIKSTDDLPPVEDLSIIEQPSDATPAVWDPGGNLPAADPVRADDDDPEWRELLDALNASKEEGTEIEITGAST